MEVSIMFSHLALEITGLSSMAPGPAPSAAPTGALPNAIKVKRLHLVDCESRETRFAYEKVEQATKISSACSGSALFAGSRSPPKQSQHVIWHIIQYSRTNFKSHYFTTYYWLETLRKILRLKLRLVNRDTMMPFVVSGILCVIVRLVALCFKPSFLLSH